VSEKEIESPTYFWQSGPGIADADLIESEHRSVGSIVSDAVQS